MNEITPAENLLVVSSHVVHGSVGCDAIQFPLNLRNWNVDCIYTTNLSTHPGYPSFRGTKVDDQMVNDLFRGLQDISIDEEYKAVIVGYIGSEEILKVAWNNILLKLNNKNIIKVLDPIMGDNGKLYVSENIMKLYLELLKKDEIEIDLLTPNQFEMELLTDLKIDSWDSLIHATEKFFLLYTKAKNVVITSLFIEGKMYCVGASRAKIFYFQVSEIEAVFSGSGDLFLGILTDEFVKSKHNLPLSLSRTIQIVEKVLNLSYYLSKYDSITNRKSINGKVYIPDLKLIQSKDILLDDVEDKDPFFLKY